MSVRKKLSLAICAALIGMLLLVTLGISGLHRAQRELIGMLDGPMVAIEEARSAQRAFTQADRALEDAHAAATLAEADAASARFRTSYDQFLKAWTRLLPLLASDAQHIEGKRVADQADAWQSAAAGFLTGTKSAATRTLPQLETLKAMRIALTDAIDHLVEADATSARTEAGLVSGGIDDDVRLFMGLGVGAAVGVLAVLVWAFVAVSGGIGAARGAAERIAAGDLSPNPLKIRRDEFGVLLSGLEGMREQLQQREAANEGRRLAEEGQQRSEQRQALLQQHVRQFEAAVRASLEALTSSATRMRATSADMTTTADDTNRKTTSAAEAASHASQNVQTVAEAAEQLDASVREITLQVRAFSTGLSVSAVCEVIFALCRFEAVDG